MFSCKHLLLTLGITVVNLSILTLTAGAQEIWQGKGRILSGKGEGASVGLKILVKNKQLTFLSGIAQGQQIELISGNPIEGKIATEVGVWRFLEFEQELGISLSQKKPYRLIHYRLLLISK